MKGKPQNLKITSSLTALSLVIAGCATPGFDESREETENKLDTVERTFDQGNRYDSGATSVGFVDSMHIAEKPYKMSQREMLPSFFHERVRFRQGDPVDMQSLTTLISEEVGIRVTFSDDAAQFMNMRASGDEGGFDPMPTSSGLPGTRTRMTINHDGTLAELLDYVTGRVGLYWAWRDSQIEIFRQETRTLSIDLENIAQSFTSDSTSSTSFVDSGGEGADDGGGSNIESNFLIQSGSTLESIGGLVSETILSQDGSLDILLDMGRVVVSDIPPKVREVEDFFEELNDLAGRQIGIKVDIMTVSSNQDSDKGWDWSALFDGSQFNVNFSTDFLDEGGNFVTGIVDASSPFSGTENIIRSISQNAQVYNHFSDFAHTTHGQITPISDNITDSYIRSIETQQADEEGQGGAVQTNIAEAKTGFDMVFRPFLTSRNKISMSMKLDINELIDMEEKNITMGEGSTTIQLPTSQVKSGYFKPILESGKSYVIGGMSSNRTRNSQRSLSDNHSMFSWLFGGRKQQEQIREFTVIIVTPHIMRN